MAYACALVEDLKLVLSHPEAPVDEKVHEVRVTIKRLRALLRLLKRRFEPEAFRVLNMRLRAISKAFSERRDQDVRDKLIRKMDLPLKPQNTRADLLDLLTTANDLLDCAGQIDRAQLKPKRLKSGLDKSWHKLKTKYKHCRRPGATSEQFHDWRKRAKDALYQMEFAREEGLDVNKRKIRAVKDLASTLGKAQDYDLLYRHLLGRRMPRESVRRVLHERDLQQNKAVHQAELLFCPLQLE